MLVISKYLKTQHDAGPKAKVDVEKILKKEYNAKIHTFNIKDNNNGLIDKIKKIIFCLAHISTKEVYIVQFPFINYHWPMIFMKHKYCIVHDVEGIRFDDKKILDKEIKVLNSFDGIVVHNNKMQQYLIDNGLKTKCVVLEFFDYLYDEKKCKNINKSIINNNIELIYPGNWSKDKAEFLYQLDESKMNFIINIYGPNKNNDELTCSKVKFKGSYPPDELIQNLEGHLGLVWSGKIDDSDMNVGDKHYNVYNYPHKMSCFLAADLPVIVWSKSAVAETVLKYNIGYIIDSIYDINNIDFSDYAEKRKNVKEIGKKIRTGYFTKKAMEKLFK